MKRLYTYALCLVIPVLLSLLDVTKISAQTNVNIPGDFQSELGCPGDWDPTCDNTALSFNTSSGLWEGTFTIPAGNWQYKVAIDHSWNENYGEGGVPFGNNIFLNLPATTDVTFKYDPVTHIVTTPLVNYTVSLAGSFQSELGCSGDWQPDCPLSSLSYDLGTNLWNGVFTLPAGSYEFKAVINNSWTENYGDGGVANGANIPLNVPVISKVSFVYDPVTHITTYSIAQTTVVIPGSFQSELGCTESPSNYFGDWDPTCDKTILTYDETQRLWVGTFDIPAGYWEYKVALDHSWNENYGLYGIRDGANIPLDLPVASNITFQYDPATHFVKLIFNTTGVCANKFYDANLDGYNDEGMPLAGIKFTLSKTPVADTSSKNKGHGGNDDEHNIIASQYSDNNGNVCFPNLKPGSYTVKEKIPDNWVATTNASQTVGLGQPQTLAFGNVCLGPGGGHDIRYWTSKQGEQTLDKLGIDYELGWLQYFSLHNQDGSDFDPVTYAQLRNWLKGANAKNISYLLSAQMAVMYLNTEAGFVNNYSIVYTPGCGYLGANANFMYAVSLVWGTNYYLSFNPVVKEKNPYRSYFECLVSATDKANSNVSFVQQVPCSLKECDKNDDRSRPLENVPVVSPVTKAKVWPNPSNSSFTLQPANNISNETVQLRVFDINGKQVYSANGNANKNYHFGDGFIPGMYMLEMIQGGVIKTFKLVKQ